MEIIKKVNNFELYRKYTYFENEKLTSDTNHLLASSDSLCSGTPRTLGPVGVPPEPPALPVAGPDVVAAPAVGPDEVAAAAVVPDVVAAEAVPDVVAAAVPDLADAISDVAAAAIRALSLSKSKFINYVIFSFTP